MILVDTSTWVDYIRAGDSILAALLNQRSVLIHPFVVGELAVGNLRDRDFILDELQRLPYMATATDSEVLRFIDRHRMYGLGIGYVACHLLAGVMLTPGASFWTRDKRLLTVASRLGLGATLLDKPNGAEPRRNELLGAPCARCVIPSWRGISFPRERPRSRTEMPRSSA